MSTGSPDPKSEYSFEEYRMQFEAAERVTDRRLNMNGRNRSYYITLVAATALAFNWAVANQRYVYIALAGIGLVSLIAIVYSIYWSAQVKDLKRLNSAKFTTLAQMAPQVVFDSINHPHMRLYDTFSAEWTLLEKAGGLQSRRGKGIQSLRATNAELFEIYAVRAVFTLFFVASLAPIVLHWSQVATSLETLLGF